MQITFHSKRWHFVLLLGEDADPGSDNEPDVYVSQTGGDFSIAPVEEVEYYEEEDRSRNLGFGFQRS